MTLKKRRQAKIIELISQNEIETQEELQDLLNRYGFEVTQATISRDIKELRLVKDLSSKGRYVYSTGKKSIENVKKSIDNDKTKWYPILISTDLYKGGALVNLLKQFGK